MALKLDADFLSEDNAEGAAFRARIRGWLEENLPYALRNRTRMLSPEEYLPWHRKLYQAGWAAPHWPYEYGGLGATLDQQIIFNEELARIGAPEWEAIHGIMLIGPVLFSHGSEAQKARHLGPILRGDEMWCQGYSEPGAGSDLASVSTRAVACEGGFIVNGHKLWTTLGTVSDYMFTLVRTDPDAARPQAGLSILIIDLASPGINRRPIWTIKGEPELAEITLDDVFVPAGNLVGGLNDGWTVANAMLGLERFNLNHPRYCFEAFEAARRVAETTGAARDPSWREAAAQVWLDVVAASAFYRQLVELTQGGGPSQAEAALLKIAGPLAMQRSADLMLDAASFGGGTVGGWTPPGGRSMCPTCSCITGANPLAAARSRSSATSWRAASSTCRAEPEEPRWTIR